MEQPVKQAQKQLQKGQSLTTSADLVIVTVDQGELTAEAATDELSFRLNRAGISLNRFWVDQTTLKAAKAGDSVQRLYQQSKQKSDFYTLFFIQDKKLYLIGTSIPDFKAAIQTLLPILVVATLLFLLLIFGLIFLLVRSQLIKPLGRLEKTTRQITELDFAASDIQEENELSSLSQSINSMKHALQQHELALLARNERLKNFSGNLSHELKTPLSIMQLLVDGEELGLENPDFLAELNQQIHHMNGLVTNILAYSQQLKEELPWEMLAISSFIENELAQQQVIDPMFELQADLASAQLQTNPQMLRIVILNLLTNALKYSVDGKMQLIGKKQGDHYQLVFRNMAHTLSDQQFSQLTEPFVVGEASRNSHLSGTGLGLSIVAETVKALNGQLTLQQVDSYFYATIFLPLKQKSAPTEVDHFKK